MFLVAVGLAGLVAWNIARGRAALTSPIGGDDVAGRGIGAPGTAPNEARETNQLLPDIDNQEAAGGDLMFTGFETGGQRLNTGQIQDPTP